MPALELVEVLGRLPYASNATLLARAEDESLWVYKPDRGERPLWDFDIGTLGSREVLAYEVAVAMGMDVIPETVVAEGPFGRGSAQRYIDEDTDVDPRPLVEHGVDERLWPFAVLDIVTNNADRKLGHMIVERATGAIWGIDQGLTFHPEDKLRTILWGFAGAEIPAALVEGLLRLCEALDDHLAARITAMLGRAESRAVTDRVETLLANPVHPFPPDDRPAVPWPMW